MIDIAAVIDHVGPSQKSFYLIKEFNRICSFGSTSVTAFVSRSAIPVCPPMFSVQNVTFISGYHGTAIATTLSEADTLLKSYNKSKKYLYLWDMEWLTNPASYATTCNILLDDRLSLIARSQSHADLIVNFCNKAPVGIVDNWEIKTLLSIVEPEKAGT